MAIIDNKILALKWDGKSSFYRELSWMCILHILARCVMGYMTCRYVVLPALFL